MTSTLTLSLPPALTLALTLAMPLIGVGRTLPPLNSFPPNHFFISFLFYNKDNNSAIDLPCAHSHRFFIYFLQRRN
ncbi:hypothetical protein T492DRAFT_1043560 [Pavlovales sp. CCMP2436]|nr:hypothetical protein T492DRAFT_1043560 [Pavlovales sp. CCMP2436]